MNQVNLESISQPLNERGFALLPRILSKEECHELMNLYPMGEKYRNVISMQRYRFGCGEYKYFAYPLPPIVQALREEFY